MSKIILLDSEPLGLLSNAKPNFKTDKAVTWMGDHQDASNRFIIPEITFYEVRRELKRAGKRNSLELLDYLCDRLEYLPIETPTMRLASDLWADLRNRGLKTTDDEDLDADCILAAQARLLDPEAIVATSNLRHLSRMAPAAIWDTIDP